MQFGVAAKPEVQARWQENRIKDDPKLPPWSTLAAGQAMKLGLDADSAIYYIGQPFALRSGTPAPPSSSRMSGSTRNGLGMTVQLMAMKAPVESKQRPRPVISLGCWRAAR